MATLTRLQGKPFCLGNSCAWSQATNLAEDPGPLVTNHPYLLNFKKESFATIRRKSPMRSAVLIGMNLQFNLGKSTTCPKIAKD